ncbi:MAG: Serine/threonine-protein kinase tel1 [Geoglossum umbratile]|nr:MAG: Serine/threonine-protein kinase tel1 [Geoglossum umbratile]
MGEVNIFSALDQIQSDRAKERVEGLADLKHILTQNRKSSRLDALNDKGFHRIYEALFRVTSSEKSLYVKTTRANLKSQLSGRLSQCAAVLRVAVEVGVKRLKYRTVIALTDHIVQTLPTAGEGYCEPLSLDYIKALRTLLEHQPHVEHFLKDEWISVVEFCCEGTTLHGHGRVVQGISSKDQSMPAQPVPPNRGSSSKLAIRPPTNRATNNLQSKANTEELVFCLQQLVSAPNAPVLEKAQTVFTAVLRFLSSSSAVSRAHQAAFAALNSVLARTRTDYISLTEGVLREAIPLMSHLWTSKSSSLKDEMIITLIYGKSHINRMMLDGNSENDRAHVESLLEALKSDYSRRLDREQLSLDDISLLKQGDPACEHTPLRLRSCCLRNGSIRSEQSWMVPQLISLLILSLDVSESQPRMTRTVSAEASHKRQRTTQLSGGHFSELLRETKSPHVGTRICALQALVFALEERNLAEAGLKSTINQLVACVSDDSTAIASWALLAIASCAYQTTAQSTSLCAEWPQIWQLASRSATSPSTCRPACHLMRVILELKLVNYPSIAASVESITSSIEISGPGALVDSALSLWALLMRRRNVEVRGVTGVSSDRLLQWLFSRWRPARFTDRSTAPQYALHAGPAHVLDLLFGCTGREYRPILSEPYFLCGSIAQAWLQCSRSQRLVNFLLLFDEADPPPHAQLHDNEPVTESVTNSVSRHHSTEVLIFDHCIHEFEKAQENWTNLTPDHAKHINADIVRIITSLCIIGNILTSTIKLQDTRRSEALVRHTEALTTALTRFLTRNDCPQVLVDAMLQTVRPYIGRVSSINCGLSDELGRESISNTLVSFSEAIEIRRKSHDSFSTGDGIDPMDIDDDFESQASRGRADAGQSDTTRQDMEAETSLATFRHSTAALLYLHFAAVKARGAPQIAAPGSVLCSTFIGHLTLLEQSELLACRSVLKAFSSSGLAVNASDAAKLLVHLGEHVLQSYDFERCEVSMGICIDVLIGFANGWTGDENEDLSEVGGDLYDWFIKVTLDKGISSPNVQIGIANLLQCLLKTRPEYRKERNLPPTQSRLVEVLRKGDIPVKFHLAEHLPEIFGLFVLKKHDAIFEEVLSSLPTDKDWIEGLALRLFTLARLASSWYTLLRRSVYHIFETPGQIPDSARHASHCLAYVSASLGLEGPQEVFKLFVSQLLYTWLATQSIRTIPFEVFGYRDLTELLSDVRDEAMGQLIMRSSDEEASTLSNILGTSFEDLAEQAFDKVIGYSIARDISVPPTDKSSQYVSGEVRIRKRLGKEKFYPLLHANFAKILALLFRTIEQEEQIERAFLKHPSFKHAKEALQEMRAISTSDSPLPANQQPSFRAKYFIDELSHLCSRTRYDISSLWNPALLTFVLRKLLDTIHPALGSLHACSVIRRIRILVCMAGVTALRDYPLEMLLHSLRPFLIDGQCADDTIGIVQYLFIHGSEYLNQAPSFLAGISLSILASIRAFLSSPQESTTQETEHRTTMSKAEAFHSWFGSYLEQYHSPAMPESHRDAFISIVRSARAIRVEGNAVKGTSESDLLQELLQDETSNRKLLNRPSQSLAYALLCANFQRPSSFRDDIFGSDEEAAANAVAVWRSCQRANIGTGYLLWAARVLGRAYASSGRAHKELTHESELDSLKEFSVGHTEHRSSSKAAILRHLRDLLLGDKRGEVGIAENTLGETVLRVIDRDPEEAYECEQVLPASLLRALTWDTYMPPASDSALPARHSVKESAKYMPNEPVTRWIRNLSISLAYAASDDAIIGALPVVLHGVDGLAEQLFPYILHVILRREFGGGQVTRAQLSEAFRDWFRTCTEATVPHVKALITTILYLRTQTIPHEVTTADRERWLDLDYGDLAEAAAKCRMFKTALLFIEIQSSKAAQASRRASGAQKPAQPTELLLLIFKHIDDPDSFYGVAQQSSLIAVMDRLEYERDGFKSLSFRGAHYDSQMRRKEDADEVDSRGMIEALNTLNLNGLSHSLLRSQLQIEHATDMFDSSYQTARKLEQWDIPAPATHKTEAATVFRAFQCINSSSDLPSISRRLDANFLDAMMQMTKKSQTGSSLHVSLRTLAVLTEIDEAVNAEDSGQLLETWERMRLRSPWMQLGRFEDVSQILSSREIIFSSLSRRPPLLNAIKTNARDARLIEVQALLESSRMSRNHGALQNSLTTATYLSALTEPCNKLGLEIGALTQFEVSNVLWDQGEMMASIRMLQSLNTLPDLRKQTIPIGKPELLAKLGHRISEARLEKPDEIISKYLLPAVKELKGTIEGTEAGQVFHEFASFCDQQLQNQDNLEDFQRIQKLRQRKEAEVQDLEKMMKAGSAQTKDQLRNHRAKARQWFELDDQEYKRLLDSRQTFLQRSLENYLLCLRACETYNNDVLRFCALWLQQSDSKIANKAVEKYLVAVPSRKFAPLMNQLSSRLLNVTDDFQSLLFSLVLRICVDHPYHGLYQIFASTKTTKGGKDEKATSRHEAAVKIVLRLREGANSKDKWKAIHDSSICYVKLAMEKLDEKMKPGSKVALRKTVQGSKLEQDVPRYRLPPPTMHIELRADCDYSKVPYIEKFQPEMTIASGISAPKIVTCIASDGSKYKQLVKGGNDDLRQDAIMEQVFGQVSELLQSNRSTRQRNLRVRTYKVLPLTTSAGIIEFVPNTIPLHDFLMPAHQKHYPKDWRPNVCRKTISDAQSRPMDHRVKAYLQVAEHFHPVMRYFFMERFDNPDDWFEKRLAYSRSIAATSILGHVLGLGDRHAHNILLDEKTGEVVHIDLGVAFEQGRVLPVPEVVPFRLTRDIVDGMGVTKTEGVFRRCCEFTLDALREESYSIMTILDVLRYDPLYLWSVSPLRIKRMQEAQSETTTTMPGPVEEVAPRKRDENEPSEADRALTVVAKKLSKTLSVTATVNELIQQATDERNLAVLYCGELALYPTIPWNSR